MMKHVSFLRTLPAAGALVLLSGCSTMSDISAALNPFSDEKPEAAVAMQSAAAPEDKTARAAVTADATPEYDAAASRALNILRFHYATQVKDLPSDHAADAGHPLPELLKSAEPSDFGSSYRDYFSPSAIADFFGKAAANVLHSEDMKPHLLGFIPVPEAQTREDAERRFIEKSADAICRSAASVGFKVAGEPRGYRLEGMIESASELKVTLVNPDLGCPAPTVRNASGKTRANPMKPPAEQHPTCDVHLRVNGMDDAASPVVMRPSWLLASAADKLEDDVGEIAVRRFGEGVYIAFKHPASAKLTDDELYTALSRELPQGWQIYLPPKPLKKREASDANSDSANDKGTCFHAPLMLEQGNTVVFEVPTPR